MDEQTQMLLTEIRDSLKSIDDRLAKWTSPETEISSIATKLELAVRDFAAGVVNAVRSANKPFKKP